MSKRWAINRNILRCIYFKNHSSWNILNPNTNVTHHLSPEHPIIPFSETVQSGRAIGKYAVIGHVEVWLTWLVYMKLISFRQEGAVQFS